jgi:hypothetical protein
MKGKHKEVYDNQGAEDGRHDAGIKKQQHMSIKDLFGPKDKDEKLTPAEKARRLHVKATHWICDTNQPLTAVEHQDTFRATMLEVLDPCVPPITYRTIASTVGEMASAMKAEAVKACCGNVICMAMNYWTSIARHNYTDMTAHWIDSSWKMHAVPLGVAIYLNVGKSGADEREKDLINILDKLQMSGIKILAPMTTDTHATMNALGMKLEQMGDAHVYCTDHVLHLTAKVCHGDNSKQNAATFGPFYESVKRGQSLVNCIHSSSQATDILKKTQERVLTVEAYREQRFPLLLNRM